MLPRVLGYLTRVEIAPFEPDHGNACEGRLHILTHLGNQPPHLQRSVVEVSM
jgi:hypothetical protein